MSPDALVEPEATELRVTGATLRGVSFLVFISIFSFELVLLPDCITVFYCPVIKHIVIVW